MPSVNQALPIFFVSQNATFWYICCICNYSLDFKSNRLRFDLQLRKPNSGNKGHIRIRSQSGKQCKPVQVHSFSRFSLWGNLRKLLVGEASPIPFERYLRYRLHDYQSFCKKQNFSFLSLQQKSDDHNDTKWSTPTFSEITTIITLLSAIHRSVPRSCHLSQGEVVQRKLCGTPRSSR